MSTLRMSPSEWAGYHTTLGSRMNRAFKAGMKAASKEIIALLVERTRQAKPASPGGLRGATNTNAYLRGWKVKPDGMGLSIFNTQPYASIIEFGRRAGSKAPPTAPIAAWLRQRHGLSASEAKSRAWVVAQAIKRRGLRPRMVLTTPRAKQDIREIVERCIDVELAKEVSKKR